MYFTAVYYSILHNSALDYTALHCTALHCSAVEQRDSVRRAPLAEENRRIGEVAAIYRNRRIGAEEVAVLFTNRIITE